MGRLGLVLAGVLMAATVDAEGVYKWVDNEGKVHYGDRPPAFGGSESIRIEAQDPGAAAAGQQRVKEQQRLLDAMKADREEREAKHRERAKQRETAARQIRQCEAARKQLREVRDANWLWENKPDGSRRILTAEERAGAEEQLEAAIARHCR